MPKDNTSLGEKGMYTSIDCERMKEASMIIGFIMGFGVCAFVAISIFMFLN